MAHESDAGDLAVLLDRLGALQRVAGDHEGAVTTYKELVALSDRSDDPSGYVKNLARLGASYGELGQTDEAVALFDEALDFALKQGDETLAYSLYRSLGDLYSAAGDTKLARDNYNMAQEMAIRVGDLEKVIAVLDEAAKLQVEAGALASAISIYYDEIDYLQELDRDADAAATLGKIAGLQQELGDTVESLRLFKLVTAQAEASGDLKLASVAQRAVASIYLQGEDAEQAVSALAQAADLAQRAGDDAGQIRALTQLGNIYRQRLRYDLAIPVYEDLLAAQVRVNDAGQLKTRSQLWGMYVRTDQYEAASKAAGRPPGITSPTDGAVLRGEAEIEALIQHPNFAKWQLDLLLDGQESQATYLEHGWSQRWGPIFTLDTTKYPNGEHTLRLRIVRDGYNYDEYFTSVVISN